MFVCQYKIILCIHHNINTANEQGLTVAVPYDPTTIVALVTGADEAPILVIALSVHITVV